MIHLDLGFLPLGHLTRPRKIVDKIQQPFMIKTKQNKNKKRTTNWKEEGASSN